MSRAASVSVSSGGALIGEGGQGKVYTMEDLFEAIQRCPTVSLVSVDLSDPRGLVQTRRMATADAMALLASHSAVFKTTYRGSSLNRSRTRTRSSSNGRSQSGSSMSARKVGSARKPPPALAGPAVPALAGPAVPAKRAPDMSEFDRILVLARAIARGPRRQQKQQQQQQQSPPAVAATLGRTTTLLVVDRRHLVVGIAIDDSGGGSCRRQRIPVYRRMAGSLEKVVDPASLSRTGLGGAAHAVVVTVLDAIEALLRSDAHHCDIKEENLMVGTNSFALTDFGYLSVPPVDVGIHYRGTLGCVSPLLYSPASGSTGREQFLVDHQTPEGVVRPAEVWASYEDDRRRRIRGRRAPLHDQLVKNDLYALGVMLARVFCRTPSHGPNLRHLHLHLQGNPEAVGAAGAARARIRAFARALMMGRGGIWTVTEARAKLNF